MVKYGVPTAESAWAMTSGLASRESAITLTERYARQHRTAHPADSRPTITATPFADYQLISPADLRRRLADLNPDTLHEDSASTELSLNQLPEPSSNHRPTTYSPGLMIEKTYCHLKPIAPLAAGQEPDTLQTVSG